MAWSGCGERKKTYYGVLAQALLGKMSCWDDMPPKRSKDELEPPDACYERERERERESTHTVTGRKSHNKQTNKIAFFVWQRGVAQPA